MTEANQKHPRDFITPLVINNIRGRMLYIPASTDSARKREILLVYGLRTCLEQVFALANELSAYGNVSCPDLPGIGGMDSMYSVGMKPTLENMANYMASLMKLKYHHKKFTAIGLSHNFALLTKVLQNHPELAGKVERVVNIDGYIHTDDLTLSANRKKRRRFVLKLASNKLVSRVIQYIVFVSPIMRYLYVHQRSSSTHENKKSKEMLKHRAHFDAHLWRINDARTHLSILSELNDVDLCSSQINVDALYAYSPMTTIVSPTIIEQHMAVAYKSCATFRLKLGPYEEILPIPLTDASSLLPKSLRKKL